MDDHNFVPLLEFGKRPECVRCKITGTGNVKKEMPAETGEGDQLHIPRDDYKYVAPIFVFSRFTAELLASLLSIPGSKSLLRYQLSYPESMSNTFTFQTAHISTLQRPAGPGYDPGEATRRVGAKLPASHPHLQGQAAQARPVHVEKEEIQGGVGFRGHGVSSCQPSAAAVGR